MGVGAPDESSETRFGRHSRVARRTTPQPSQEPQPSHKERWSKTQPLKHERGDRCAMPAAPDGAPPLRLRINLAAATVQGVPSPPGAGERDALALPPGEAQLSTQKKHKADLMGKRAMETALAPGKNIFMQGFMMYMSGSSINIWSMMVVGMAFVNPIKALLAIDETFARFASSDGEKLDLTLPKLAFAGCNCAMLALALWKLNTMRLLPITAADWTSFLVDKVDVEASSVPLTL
jgi:hypothetical protein